MARDLSSFLESFQEAAVSSRALREQFPDMDGQLKEITHILRNLDSKKRPDLRGAENAYQALTAYIAETFQASKEQEARSKAIHDMVASRLPQVTDGQMQAYEAQKAAYDEQRRDIKAQTEAVTAAMARQTAAIEKNAKAQEEILQMGESAAKIDGKDTIVSRLFSGFMELQRQEKQAQADAIKAEGQARIDAIQEEAEYKKLKKPEDPRKVQQEQQAQIERDIARLPGIETVSVAELAAGEKKAIAYATPVGTVDLDLGEAPDVGKTVAKKEAAPVPTGAKAGPGPKPVALKEALPVGRAEGAVGIARSLGSLASTAGHMLGPMAVVAQMLKDINDAFPIVTKGIGAIADASRTLGPLLISLGMELDGYILELGARITESIATLAPGASRAEKLEESGALTAERIRAENEAMVKSRAIGDALTGALGRGMGRMDAKAPLQRIEQTFTTPAEAEAQPAAQGAPSTGSRTEDLQKMIEDLARLQAQSLEADRSRGVGSTPILMQSPSLSMFPT